MPSECTLGAEAYAECLLSGLAFAEYRTFHKRLVAVAVLVPGEMPSAVLYCEPYNAEKVQFGDPLPLTRETLAHALEYYREIANANVAPQNA